MPSSSQSQTARSDCEMPRWWTVSIASPSVRSGREAQDLDRILGRGDRPRPGADRLIGHRLARKLGKIALADADVAQARRQAERQEQIAQRIGGRLAGHAERGADPLLP